MKHIIKVTTIVALCLSSLFAAYSGRAHATSNTSDWMEASQIYNKFKTIDEDKYIDALKACGAKGNPVCNQKLGYIYYEKEWYDSSRSYFLKCSRKANGTCDAILGYLYEHGLGVLQSDQKALKYYELGAKIGNKYSAYNACIVYTNRAASLLSNHDNKSVESYKYNSIRAYAWLKIAVALGERTDPQGYPISEFVNRKKNGLAYKGYLEEADRLAIEICSKVQGCNQ